MRPEPAVTKVRSRLLAVAALLLTGGATAADSNLTFTGELQEVTTVSVSVRLIDGRVIEARNTATAGDLLPRTLAGMYTVGDQVEITCAAIDGVYYPQIGHNLVLEVKKLRFLRKPNDEERSKALASRAWRWRPRYNLLRPGATGTPAPVTHDEPATAPSPEWSARVERIRSHVLEFASSLPNFVADEVAVRYVSPSAPPKWRLVDTIEAEASFRGSVISREHITLNGKPWNRPYSTLPGWKWQAGLGSDLPRLFGPNCPTTFQSEGRVSEGGKSLSVVGFSSPPDGCVGIFWSGYQVVFTARAGRIKLDEREENVIRLEANSQDMPKAFPMGGVQEQVTWDYVNTGDGAHLLPVSTDVMYTLGTGEMRLIKLEYKKHRRFEAFNKTTVR